jgi:hypothetical protein
VENVVKRAALAIAVSLAPVLAACHKTPPAEDSQPDVNTEARREQVCADPQWKADNLGLWYNLCSTGDR